ncbi:hypothetical protein B0J14DRAFT_67032 [Halenospora varia]|nr:hypothetical protein B0J14DRAFT_67032 [Halenospora varia]
MFCVELLVLVLLLCIAAVYCCCCSRTEDIEDAEMKSKCCSSHPYILHFNLSIFPNTRMSHCIPVCCLPSSSKNSIVPQGRWLGGRLISLARWF